MPPRDFAFWAKFLWGQLQGMGRQNSVFAAQVSLRDVKKRKAKEERKQLNDNCSLYCNTIYGYTGYMVVLFST